MCQFHKKKRINKMCLFKKKKKGRNKMCLFNKKK